MDISFTDALSPLDGRYAGKLAEVRRIFSEAGLMRERVRVECAWVLALAAGPAAHPLKALPAAARGLLTALAANPEPTDVAAIKKIEASTNHDVKAVEYWLRGELKSRGASAPQLEWIHFACTSEDINNLAYALMLKTARDSLLLPMLETLHDNVDALAVRHAGSAMLARTHGQTASPTTVGKELANVAARLESQRNALARVTILGKINGAVGNFNAHAAALPGVDWPQFSAEFVASLGLQANPHTTQIEPHDWIAEYCHALMRANTVLLDFSRDMWSYISLGYFKQRPIAGEVGSSTMPHKVNPIDFENAEGNLGLANALLGHFADKLPVSRLQRDLTDSTVLRNVGVAIGHCVLSFKSLTAGLGKLELDEVRIAEDLGRAWEVLAEAVQTVMRAHGIPDAYDKLKTFTRGRPIDAAAMREFIASVALPPEEKARLMALTPAAYVGLAPLLALRGKRRNVT
ncbi:MAG TPA: adenylosuccinate lyase [Steroidobacteraceae bacterium]|jgi:adenylosuccinate lyase|nr:adenylosuccinate lyase [Steroidobacteraceae bacterium]